jgi:hypothetical protein
MVTSALLEPAEERSVHTQLEVGNSYFTSFANLGTILSSQNCTLKHLSLRTRTNSIISHVSYQSNIQAPGGGPSKASN